jgi:hypothetical protein
VSAAFGSLVDDGFGKGHRQHPHPAAESGAAPEGLGSLGPGRHKPRNRPATISNSHLVALPDLFNQGSKVLPGFTYARLFHWPIVLHVAQFCKRPHGNLNLASASLDRDVRWRGHFASARICVLNSLAP